MCSPPPAVTAPPHFALPRHAASISFLFRFQRFSAKGRQKTAWHGRGSPSPDAEALQDLRQAHLACTSVQHCSLPCTLFVAALAPPPLLHFSGTDPHARTRTGAPSLVDRARLEVEEDEEGPGLLQAPPSQTKQRAQGRKTRVRVGRRCFNQYADDRNARMRPPSLRGVQPTTGICT